jgi:hypothetical protein
MNKRIELLGGLATLVAIAGVILNNCQLWPCFLLWFVSNGLTLWIHYQARIWSLVARDAIFLVLAIVGLIQWTA